jgi:Phage tail assembly chaperone protein
MYNKMDIDDWNVIMGRRMMRDQLLKDSDKYMLNDYPISNSNLELVKQYRQALRDYMDIPELVNYNSNVIIPPIPQFPF